MLSFSNLMLSFDPNPNGSDEMLFHFHIYYSYYIYYSYMYVSGLELATPIDSVIIIKLYTLNNTQQYNIAGCSKTRINVDNW